MIRCFSCQVCKDKWNQARFKSIWLRIILKCEGSHPHLFSIWNIFCAELTILSFYCFHLFSFLRLKGERPSITVCNFFHCPIFLLCFGFRTHFSAYLSQLHLSTDNIHIPSKHTSRSSIKPVVAMVLFHWFSTFMLAMHVHQTFQKGSSGYSKF